MTEVAGPPPPTRGRRAFQWLSLFAIVLIPVAAIAWLALPKAGCACSPTSPPALSSPVVGVVVAVDSSGLGRVAGFTVRLADGSSAAFELGALENAAQFSPSHITEHMATSQPIRVFFTNEPQRRVVYRLEDATGSPTSSP